MAHYVAWLRALVGVLLLIALLLAPTGRVAAQESSTAPSEEPTTVVSAQTVEETTQSDLASQQSETPAVDPGTSTTTDPGGNSPPASDVPPSTSETPSDAGSEPPTGEASAPPPEEEQPKPSDGIVPGGELEEVVDKSGDGDATTAPDDEPGSSPSASVPPSDTTTTTDADGDDAQSDGTESTEEIDEIDDTEASPSASPVAQAAITVYTYLCASDPGAVTPGTTPSDCVVQPAVEIVSYVDGGEPLAGVFTNGNGEATVSAPVGSSVLVEELLPEGIEPLLDGYALIEEMPATGTVLAFLNISQETASSIGRLQIVSATCPTSGASNTEFRIVGPFRVAAQDDGCTPNVLAYFTIKGGPYGDSGLTVPTDREGTWRGRVAPGTYTIVEDATGAVSAALQVAAGETTVVVALNYQGKPNGELEIYRYVCDATERTTDIAVSASSGDPGAPEGGCDLGAGTVQLNDGTPFTLNAGAHRMSMPAGSYTFTDLASSRQAPFDIALGTTTRIVVVDRLPAATITARALGCSNPAAGSVDPRNHHYFYWTCGNVDAGTTLSLRDASGGVLGEAKTDGGGYVTWKHVPPGSYTVSSSRRTCAIFGGDRGSLFGWGDGPSAAFGVGANETASITLYGCQSNSFSYTGGGIGDGSALAPGRVASAGAATQSATTNAASVSTVTSLPKTGTGVAAVAADRSSVGGWLAVMLVTTTGLWLSLRQRRALG